MAARYKTIKQYVHALLLLSVSVDEDGRRVGLGYIEILKRILRRFPTVTYKGPHFGHPTQMTVEELRRLACAMQRDDPTARLPVRPRPRKAKRKKKVKS